jgi:ABC-2 type transport system permease protein
MKPAAYLDVLLAITGREMLRFISQRERLLSGLVRPLLWLVVFAAGFRSVLGLSITPPYQTYVLYELYITPGLAAMTLLFSGMQTSLAMVYDRSMGAMRVLLTSPFPRGYLLFAKLAGGVAVGLMQAYAFLLIALVYGIDLPPLGLLAALPALAASAFMVGAAGLVLAAYLRRVDNFAAVMNFVIFPAFFLSSALYPLWKMQESSEVLARICRLNPFTHAVELVRFALHLRFEPMSAAVVLGVGAALTALAIWSYDPARSFRAGRTAGEG